MTGTIISLANPPLFRSVFFSLTLFLIVFMPHLLCAQNSPTSTPRISKSPGEITTATQGEYAVILAEKLGLGTDITDREAFSTLERVGIRPRQGWRSETKVTGDFVVEILELTMRASQRGLIDLSSKEVYGIVTDLPEQLKKTDKGIIPEAEEPLMEEGVPPEEEREGIEEVELKEEVVTEEELSDIENFFLAKVPSTISTELRQFGYRLFQTTVSTFAPIVDVPVGPDYTIGPGDSFTIVVWGRVNLTYDVIVGRTGEITLPELGVLQVWGMTLEKLKDYLYYQFSRKFTDFKMNITMGQLRSIRVFVVGEAQTPGSYTLSSLSTVFNALFAAGGPSKRGSMRNIQLNRSGKIVETIDLYDFLLKGDKSQDIRLQNEDTIFIPLIGPVVAVAENVKRPAIYELKEPMNLSEVLELAGGVTPMGDLQRIQVERIIAHEKRVVVDFNLSARQKQKNQEGLMDTIIQDRDLVRIFPVLPVLQNVVYLEGHVYRPGEYELKEGMTLRDLIPSYDVLLPEPHLEFAEIVRLMEPDLHPVVITFHLRKLLEGDPAENIELTRFDRIRILPWDERLKNTVSISGLVYRPGDYRLTPNMRICDLISSAGSFEKNAYLKRAELTRRLITQKGMKTKKIEINLEKAYMEDPSHNILLQDYDHLSIRSIPELEFDREVCVTGEVMFPGCYPIERGETLSSLIERSGGYTERAYLRGAFFTRESARMSQQERLNELIMKMEQEILTVTSLEITGALSKEDVMAQQESLAARQELLAKLKAAKAEGRVLIKLASLGELKGSKYDLELEKGDELFIPEKPGVVNVIGEVYNPTSVLCEKGQTVGYYLNQVGGPTEGADEDQIFVIQANGKVIAKSQKGYRSLSWDSDGHRWTSGDFMAVQLLPGDTILVPKKLIEFQWLKTTKDITQILYQIAVAAGVVIAAY